jgi:hypothetical protein
MGSLANSISGDYTPSSTSRGTFASQTRKDSHAAKDASDSHTAFDGPATPALDSDSYSLVGLLRIFVANCHAIDAHIIERELHPSYPTLAPLALTIEL